MATRPDAAKYVRRTVYPYSRYYRSVLAAEALRGDDPLARVPPTDLAAIADPSDLVLQPSFGAIVREGTRGLAARVLLARAVGTMQRFSREVVDYEFKPVHWVVTAGLPIGYSTSDLVVLAGRGQRWLELAGIERDDVVVSLLDPAPSVARAELSFGCRRARVSALHLNPGAHPAWVEQLAPSVLAGRAWQLEELLSRARPAGLRVLLVVDDPIDATARERLVALAGGADIVAAWAPPGVRSVWTECRGAGQPAGYHVDEHDVVETGEGGELLWTGLGWRASAVLRLRTRVAGTVAEGACPRCGRRTARVLPSHPLRDAGEPETIAPEGGTSAPEAVLEREPDVAAWRVERRIVDGRAEAVVTVVPAWGVPVAPLLRRLARQVEVTQFVVAASLLPAAV